MKNFWCVFSFEFVQYLKNKIFVGVTLGLVAVIGIFMFYPNIKDTFFNSKEKDPQQQGTMVLCAGEDLLPYFNAGFYGYNIQLVSTEEEAKQAVQSSSADCGFIIMQYCGRIHYNYLVQDPSLYDDRAATATAILQQYSREATLAQSNLTQQQIQTILSPTVQGDTTVYGKDQSQNYFYTYIMMFALYMVILLYGQMVATNVASEKSSRAMELLITSADPVAMMFGKVLSSCCAGLLQLGVVFGSSILFYRLNAARWEDNPIVQSVFDMPLSLLWYMLIFFVLGFFLYGFMFGAIGSLATKVEDVNTSVMPLTMVFVVVFVAVMAAMGSGKVDSPLMVFLSYLPLSSPMAMFTRIAMSTIAPWQVLLSIGLLAACTFLVGLFSARVYRVGVLLYGTSPKLKNILAQFFKRA